MSYDFNILADDPALQAESSSGLGDTTLAQTDVPVQEPQGLERVMLAEDKLFVVLAVVLIIWIGIAALILRTDKKLDRVQKQMDDAAAHDRAVT